MSRVTTLLWPAGQAALAGALAYTLSDAVNDALVYRQCQRIVLVKADSNPVVREQLGSSLSFGPWYNASVSLTHRGHIANCSCTLVGSKASSDVHLRVIRRGGSSSRGDCTAQGC
ncbi:hypothetical protein WJX72_001667 [[Myrmecia] bisecta]|uniref:Uncharacterized protein n=1 Tax=[Myrmecia] bisecta TaxID=41462 RepID=A0AAW1QE70_9CHLO